MFLENNTAKLSFLLQEISETLAEQLLQMTSF